MAQVDRKGILIGEIETKNIMTLCHCITKSIASTTAAISKLWKKKLKKLISPPSFEVILSAVERNGYIQMITYLLSK